CGAGPCVAPSSAFNRCLVRRKCSWLREPADGANATLTTPRHGQLTWLPAPRVLLLNVISEEPTKGFEPPTHALRKHCSTPELRRRAGTPQYINGSGDQAVAFLAVGELVGAGATGAVGGLAIVAVQLLRGAVAATAERALPIHGTRWCTPRAA